MEQLDLSKPSLLRRMFAHGADVSMIVTTCLFCAAVLSSMRDGIFEEYFGILEFSLLLFSALGLGVILGRLFVWQLLWHCGLALLGKPANGDIVEVIKGPYRGRTGKVYDLETWDARGQFRVDIGENTAQGFEDVFFSNEVMVRQTKVGKHNLKARIRNAEVESKLALALLPVGFVGVFFYRDFSIWGALLAAVLLPSVVFWVCASAMYGARQDRQLNSYKRKFIVEDEFRDILTPYMDKMIVQRTHLWIGRRYSSLCFKMSEDRLPEGKEQIDLYLSGDWYLLKNGVEVCDSMSPEGDAKKVSLVEIMRGAKFENVEIGDTIAMYFSNGFQVVLKPSSSRPPDVRIALFSFHFPEGQSVRLVEGKPPRFELEVPERSA